MSEETSHLAERGDEVFERVVRPQLQQESWEDDYKHVAIDVTSEDVEVKLLLRSVW